MTTPTEGTPIRVLLADDSAADIELAVVELERSGLIASYDSVQTAEEFKRCLAGGSYDIVLSDYRMPGWTGLDALRMIKKAGLGIPLILVTGTLGDENAVDCVKLGVADYVLKQNLSRLPFAVRRALQESRARHERQLVEERFAELAENTSDVFFVVEGAFQKTLYVNPAYERVWQQSRQRIYEDAQAFLAPIPDEDRAAVVASMERAVRGVDNGEIEFRLHWPDGQVRWMFAHPVPIRDEHGNVRRVSGIVRDITERKRAEQLLRESEERYRTLTDASFDGIAVSMDGILVRPIEGTPRCSAMQ